MSDPLAPLRKGKVSADSEFSASKVWLKDEVDGYVPAAMDKDGGAKVTVIRADTKQTVEVPKEDTLPMNPPKFDKREDMAELTLLNEAAVLHNLRRRYDDDLIYTYSGLFCVVVNPYKNIPIYTDAVINCYKGAKRENLPPHVYAIADQAYRDMLQDREDQSILCTGESGAGKTENTKKVIQYLAAVAAGGSQSKSEKRNKDTNRTKRRQSGIHALASNSDLLARGKLEHQLLQANPIMETFGNAATIKNDNSSRFGKFIKIHFDTLGYINGAKVETYLLEKSRCVLQGEDERCFHAFYQLLAEGSVLSELGLSTSAGDHQFLTNGPVTLANVNDKTEYGLTNQAFQIIGLRDEEIHDVWRTVAGVLAFGNIIPDVENDRRGEQARMKGDTALKKCAEVLGIRSTELSSCLLKPKVKAGRDFVQKAQNKEKVDFAIESLAKATYERLFIWVVTRINETLDLTSRNARSFIGILDIAGFEIFKENSFEQLCINYTNEKLQQLFNRRMFVLEQEEYAREQIEWEMIDFGLDLQPTIDLIEKVQPPGILALVDDQCAFPKATDKTLVDKLVEKVGGHDKFKASGFRGVGDFSVVHYAGVVHYSAARWLEKNSDPVNDNVVALLEKSSFSFVANLWGDKLSNYVASAGKTRKGALRTVSKLYKERLGSLMETLNATTPNFVRCIIPNHKKKPGLIDGPLVLGQLACNGVLEGIRIVRKGFPNRVLFQDFKVRYQLLTPGAFSGFMSSKSAVEKMVTIIKVDPATYRIGQTKIFFKAGALAELEEKRDSVLTEHMVGLQAYCRGYIARLHSNVGGDRVKAARLIQRNVRKYIRVREWPWWKLFVAVKRMGFPQVDVLSQLRSELEQWKQLAEEEARRREEVEAEVPKLESEKRQLIDALEHEKSSLADCDAQRQRLDRQTKELAQSLGDQEAALDAQMETAQQLVGDKKGLLEQLEGLRAERDAIPVVNPEKVAAMETEQAELKEAMQLASRDKGLAEETIRKQKRELEDVKDGLETAGRQLGKTEAQIKALQEKHGAMTADMASERGGITDRDALLGAFDSKLKAAREQTAAAQAEKDALQSASWELNTQVLVTKSQVEDTTDSLEHLERQLGRLEVEIGNATPSASVTRDGAAIKKAVAELEGKRQAQNQTILDLEDSIMLAEQAIPRLEVNIGALEQKLATVQHQSQDEGRNRALRQQLRDIQEEIELEKRTFSKSAKEKEVVESNVTMLRTSVEEETVKREQFTTRLRTMEAKLKSVDEPGEPSGHNHEINALKAKISRYQREIDRDEEQLRKTKKEKRRFDDEIENLEEMLSAYHKEAGDLRRQVRDVRQARFREETSVESVESPRYSYREKVTYRKVTTTTTTTSDS